MMDMLTGDCTVKLRRVKEVIKRGFENFCCLRNKHHVIFNSTLFQMGHSAIKKTWLKT